MKPITLRGVPPELERVLVNKASESGESLNRIVIALLEKGAGLRPKRKRVLHHDLDTLFGVWSVSEAEVFERHIAEQRRLEPGL